MLASIVVDGTVDLLIFEAYTYNWEGSGSLDEAAIDRRLAFAKAHSIINKTIACFGFVLSTNPKNRSQAGMTYAQIHSLVIRFKAKYPEMPGVAFSSEGLAANDTGSLALVQRAASLALKLYPDFKTDDNGATAVADGGSWVAVDAYHAGPRCAAANITNHDIADVRGDLYYTARAHAAPVECRPGLPRVACGN